MRTIDFELTGETALLMHQDSVEASDSLADWRKAPENKGKSKAGDDRSPAWTWQTYLYSDGEHVVMPYENVSVCIRQAATQIILKKQKTFKELSQSGIIALKEHGEFFVDDKKLSMLDIVGMKDLSFSEQSDAVRKLGFKLFVKRAKIGQSKHIRVRPRFDKWRVRGSYAILSDDLTDEIITQIFTLAGRVGIGDWRPGCKTPGPFGMFEAKVKF